MNRPLAASYGPLNYGIPKWRSWPFDQSKDTNSSWGSRPWGRTVAGIGRWSGRWPPAHFCRGFSLSLGSKPIIPYPLQCRLLYRARHVTYASSDLPHPTPIQKRVILNFEQFWPIWLLFKVLICTFWCDNVSSSSSTHFYGLPFYSWILSGVNW